MKKIVTKSLILAVTIVSAANAEYDDAGTDYSVASVDRWTEDASNEFVSMANSFACMLKNNAMGSNPNNKWEALVSEYICGLNQDLDKNDLSRSVNVSSRASNSTPQEGQFYFYGSGDRKFVGNIISKRSPEEFGPYGEWYVSYYLAQADGSPVMNHDTSVMKGLVDIAETSGGKISLKTVDRADFTTMGSPEDMNLAARIEYDDSTLATSKILGREWGTNDQNASINRITAGKTNANYYYRVTFPNGESSTPTAQCLKRDSSVETTHEIGLFDKTTGAKVALSGGFGFTYGTSNSSRGFFDRWGVWFDGSRLSPFNPSVTTLSVKSEKDDLNYTLNWAPGTLKGLTTQTENLSQSVTMVTSLNTPEGDKELHISWSGSAYQGQVKNSNGSNWSTSGSSFPTEAEDGLITQSDISAHPWLGWSYSDEKRSQIYWGGGNSISFNVESDKSADSTLLAASYTSFTSRWGYGIDQNLPVDASEYDSNKDMYNHLRNNSGANSGTKYYFTGLTPPTGKLPRTLYIDLGTEGPTTEDKALMFDFNINTSDGKYVEFGSGGSAGTGYSSTTNKWTDTGDDWPHAGIELLDSSSNRYRWSFGAYPWEQSVIATKVNGDVLQLDEPLKFVYSYTSSDDRNSTLSSYDFLANINDHNPVRNYPGVCTTSGVGSGYEKCTLTPASFNGKKFLLQYDGNWLSGLPDVRMYFSDSSDSKNYWARLVNPKDGTILTEASTGKEYVIKALAVSEAFVEAPTSVFDKSDSNCYVSSNSITCDCDDLAFNSASSFGWALTDLPAVTDYPTISQAWSDQPSASELTCTVTMGDSSGCSN